MGWRDPALKTEAEGILPSFRTQFYTSQFHLQNHSDIHRNALGDKCPYRSLALRYLSSTSPGSHAHIMLITLTWSKPLCCLLCAEATSGFLTSLTSSQKYRINSCLVRDQLPIQRRSLEHSREHPQDELRNRKQLALSTVIDNQDYSYRAPYHYFLLFCLLLLFGFVSRQMAQRRFFL